MGNTNSNSSGDEEEVEVGSSGAVAADGTAVSPTVVASTDGSALNTGLPSSEVLLSQSVLRETAARLNDVVAAESAVTRNHSALIRWLEERHTRGEEVITQEQYCEMLENRSCTREECEESFAQFDAEGDGIVDVENMLEALRTSTGANLQGELSHVIRQLQACSLTPGFVDIFSKSKEELRVHAAKILKFLHRNRISSNAVPFPMLDGYNNIHTMRSSVMKDYLEQILQKENDLNIEKSGDAKASCGLDQVKMINKCFRRIETSSNCGDIDRLTNGETSSFWQSDGSARSHWIRLRLKPGIILRHLSFAVAAGDQSYMPQQVSVTVGKHPNRLHEIREIHIPSNVTGYVTLLENASISFPVVQINIKRCHSDGCDTRIHGLRTVGYIATKKQKLSVSDASAIWYLSLLTSLVTSSLETNPALGQTVIQNTKKALQHMPPLSLTQASAEFPNFLSTNVLEEVDSFLTRIVCCCVIPDVELTLLAFALARGSVAKILSSLSIIFDHLDTEYKAFSLIKSMETVRQNLLFKYGKALNLTLQACDVKGKEEKSGPENLLLDPGTGDGFLSETGKNRASIIFSTGTDSALQVTQLRLRVRKGGIGAKCGLVFAYNHDSKGFQAEEHFKRFEKYDTWKLPELKEFMKDRTSSSDILGEDDPVGWFETEEDCDEIDVRITPCQIAKYLMVKFLCTRQDSAERLGVQNLSIFGYLRPFVGKDVQVIIPKCEKNKDGTVSGAALLLNGLIFVQQLTLDLVQQNSTKEKQKLFLDFSGLNIRLFWNFYKKLQENAREECIQAQTVLLKLLQNCCSLSSGSDQSLLSEESTGSEQSSLTELGQEFFRHLCEVVDSTDEESDSLKALKEEVTNTVLNGAAIFFPDQQTRRDRLFNLLNVVVVEKNQSPSVQLTFRSLCNYFSAQDPSGLLLLPKKGIPSDFEMKPVLTVMENLLSAATGECKMMMKDASQQENGTILSSLFWAVQGSFLTWCYLQLKVTDTEAPRQARDLLVKYVELFLSSTRTTLKKLMENYTGNDIMEKLKSSVLAMAARQLVIFLMDFSLIDIPHGTLLEVFAPFSEVLKDLCSNSGENFAKLDMENWKQSQEPIVLRTWTVESSHNYANNCHETTVFTFPGATYFEVDFDEKCATEKRYDYLEFTDARGTKVRYESKVGTEKWPKKVTFKAGPRLQFLFHSDSSTNEWGYKFTVTAYGLPDVVVSWGSDLLLLVSKLMGRLASRIMSLKSTCELSGVTEPLPANMNILVNSPLWKPVFQHGLFKEHSPDLPVNDLSCLSPKSKQSQSSSDSDIFNILMEFAKWDPSQNTSSTMCDLLKTLVQMCKKQTSCRSDLVEGCKIDQAVNAAFAALVYHVPDLQRALKGYVASGGQLSISDELVQAYSLAEGIRIWMLEVKQKSLQEKVNESKEKHDIEEKEMSPENLAKTCIQKSILLLCFSPVGRKKAKPHSIDIERQPQKSGVSQDNFDAASDGDFQVPDSVHLSKAGDSSTSSKLAASVSVSGEQSQKADTDRKTVLKSECTHVSCKLPSKASAVSYSRTSSESMGTHSEPSSPATPTLRSALGRGLFRLLSHKSVEEPKAILTVKVKYPILKNILDFIKDQSVSCENVLQVLSLKKAQAISVHQVLKVIRLHLETLGQPHLLQAPCVVFLLELLTCQKDFTNYFGHLEGCGPQLHKDIRESYYQLVLLLVHAVRSFNDLDDRSLLPALSCVQTCLLHLLDMSWEPSDLAFFIDIKLADLLLTMSQENISSHDSAICQWTEEEEITDYDQNTEWMDECQDGMFETWYETIAQASPEIRRKMHMFIARYCDLLNVEISCDGCDKIAPWHRYRCLQCNDMDLCKTCFLGGVKPEGHEDSHEMVNMEYACDHCQGLIVGRRIHCNICDDFDLCFGCYSAKKYPDSHVPTHSITVYPMVTIRISDRQRLIQPYLHNYSWLLFASLALYAADLANKKEVDGEPLEAGTMSSTKALQRHCIDLIADCLLKAQQGKGLRASALLFLLPVSEPVLDAKAATTITSTEEKTEVCKDLDSKAASNTAGSSDDALFSTVSKEEKSSRPPPSTENTLDAVTNVPANESVKAGPISEVPAEEKAEAKVLAPTQEQVFAEYSQERILGLLAAMLPPPKQGSSFPLINLEQILPLLFQVVISNAGHLNETYHLTLGLLGKLLLQISPADADAAVTVALSAKHSLFSVGDGVHIQEGWKTTQLLFSLGAVCLDSRVGLDWACSMADILRDLNTSPRWREVMAAFTDHCIKHLPFQLNRTNIFTLLVLVGFPEVLSMGSLSVYMDNADEPHNVIILKHFTEKNRAVVVDTKTRKRKTVKDYQLVQFCEDEGKDMQSKEQGKTQNQLKQYVQQFVFIISHLLQTNMDCSYTEAVEATWVLALALKGLYNILKTHGVEEIQSAILQSGLMKLLVKKCSKGTGFSKTWLLRDLEILSIMLYSSKKEITSFTECADAEADDTEPEQDQDLEPSSAESITIEQNKPDPLEGLDEATKICFLITHDALNAPLHILRAMYELQMKKTESFFQEVQKRFDGNTINVDETIRTLAQKWQPSKRLRSEESSGKAVDTDMIIVPCVSKPVPCEKATEETNPVTQKLVTNTESDLQLSCAKQRRTKSSMLLHKELDTRNKKSIREYLFKVNEAIAILYARHVLASLLAYWPSGVAVTEEALELTGASHMAYILDMLMQLEEKQMWEQILKKLLQGCSESMLDTLALTACQFMEEPGMAVQVRESKHPYDNNTNFEDKVHIPGALYLSVKFDPGCNTEEGCDGLLMSSSSDFKQDEHSFSGSSQKWIDFEIPGDTLYYRFTSDISNTEWGYKFTVSGGHRGRFQTGFEILKQMLSDERALQHLQLKDIWEWQVGVACHQTGFQRLKAIHLLLRILQCPQSNCNLILLKPLWQLFTNMESSLCQESNNTGILLPLHRALTELFFIAENKALERGCLQEYLLALTTEDHLHRCTVQAVKSIAAISLAIDYENKATELLSASS
ncbi:zinc finger ZZ-type and EF-hand domain-containing protein 1 [Protopterus annectens]|uniref:zinc finger ZZ-type and EF-hand domain-containing protein 1 n=1 Tax=Protopterus annectens TaxID=7888 RepID=UPI001CFBAC94|nr:zinc finger ZZ-type and EF-hand domain-containing protein 1 [Protopterus annectens]